MSNGTQRMHPDGMPVPFFFQAPTATNFEAMDMINSDVVLATLPFGGTMWVHKILQNLLHLIDDDGHLSQANEAPSATGQIFVESLPTELIVPQTQQAEAAEKIRRELFGGPRGIWRFEHLLNQPEPRVFSTHMYGGMLPSSLLAPNGKGKLVVTVRNLKMFWSPTTFSAGSLAMAGLEMNWGRAL